MKEQNKNEKEIKKESKKWKWKQNYPFRTTVSLRRRQQQQQQHHARCQEKRNMHTAYAAQVTFHNIWWMNVGARHGLSSTWYMRRESVVKIVERAPCCFPACLWRLLYWFFILYVDLCLVCWSFVIHIDLTCLVCWSFIIHIDLTCLICWSYTAMMPLWEEKKEWIFL